MFTIRARLFTGLIIITLGGFLYLTYWVVTGVRVPGLRGTEESLVECAGILAALAGKRLVQEGDSAVYTNLHAAFDSVYKQEAPALLYGEMKEYIENRVYITDTNGIVLFDSYSGKDEGRDYSQWNDVYLTLRGEYGARTSHDDPFDPGSPYIYVGAPIKAGEEIIGVLSVGKPAGLIGGFIRRARNRLILFAVIAFLIVALAGIFLTLWVSRPIEKLTRYTRQVAKGETARMGPLGKGFFYGRSEIDSMGDAVEEMRRALEGRQYVENYIMTLVHTIKAQLNGIVASAGMLDELLGDPECKRYNEDVLAEAESIARAADELMDLVKLECREKLEKAEPVPVDELVNNIIKIRQHACSMKNITLRCGECRPVTVFGDRSLIMQAVRNLVENAIDFTPAQGEIVVSVRKEKNSVSIIIEDTGTGIPDYAINRIFEKYYSIARPDTNKKSSGLGLNFVKEVASIHGGEITVRNRKERGVRAELQLPVKQIVTV